MLRACNQTDIKAIVGDRGYQKLTLPADCAAAGIRTYIPQLDQPHDHVWTDKPAAQQRAYHNNRRLQGARSKRLQRRCSEYVERTFAHVCETGCGRRSWLWGLLAVSKR